MTNPSDPKADENSEFSLYDKEIFGPTVKRLRERKNLPQEDLAAEASISTKDLSLYESGRQMPNYENRGLIFAALGVTPEQFYDEMLRTESWLRARPPEVDVSARARSHWLSRSLAELGSRYMPEDHVEVEVAKAFDGLRRSNAFAVKGEESRGTALRAVEDARRLLHGSSQDIMKQLDELAWALEKPKDWPLPNVETGRSKWINAVVPLRELLKIARSSLHSRAAQPMKTQDEIQSLLRKRQDSLRAMDQLMEVLASLGERWRTIAYDADEGRSLLLHGVAGSGKSHLLADVARRAEAERAPAILLLGHQFVLGDALAQMASICGACPSPNAWLDALDAEAKRAGRRGIILIDALNEGPGASLWNRQLAGVINAVLSRPHLAIAVSCRSEYWRAVIPEKVAEQWPKAEAVGFRTLVEQDQASRQYMDKRGIVRPATPWLPPLFSNPLFLKTACDTLSRRRESHFPRGIVGARTCFEFYETGIQETLEQRLSELSLPVKTTKDVLVCIARRMLKNRSLLLRREELLEAIGSARTLQGFPSHVQHRIQREFEREGVLLRTIDPLDPEGGEVTQFSFQYFADHFMAEALLEGVAGDYVADAPERFAFIWRDFTTWAGLAIQLSVAIPEKFQKEFMDLATESEGGSKAVAVSERLQVFAESLLWRDPKSYSQRTLELCQLMPWTGLWGLLGVLLRCACFEGHPLNANFLVPHIRSWPRERREQDWSRELVEATHDLSHPVYVLIDWCLNGAAASANAETLRLVVATLALCLSTTSRAVRDRATKALAFVLAVEPAQGVKLIEGQPYEDDPCGYERVAKALHGAALRAEDPCTLAEAHAALSAAVKREGVTHIGVLAVVEELGALLSARAAATTRSEREEPAPKMLERAMEEFVQGGDEPTDLPYALDQEFRSGHGLGAQILRPAVEYCAKESGLEWMTPSAAIRAALRRVNAWIQVSANESHEPVIEPDDTETLTRKWSWVVVKEIAGLAALAAGLPASSLRFVPFLVRDVDPTVIAPHWHTDTEDAEMIDRARLLLIENSSPKEHEAWQQEGKRSLEEIRESILRAATEEGEVDTYAASSVTCGSDFVMVERKELRLFAFEGALPGKDLSADLMDRLDGSVEVSDDDYGLERARRSRKQWMGVPWTLKVGDARLSPIAWPALCGSPRDRGSRVALRYAVPAPWVVASLELRPDRTNPLWWHRANESLVLARFLKPSLTSIAFVFHAKALRELASKKLCKIACVVKVERYAGPVSGHQTGVQRFVTTFSLSERWDKSRRRAKESTS